VPRRARPSRRTTLTEPTNPLQACPASATLSSSPRLAQAPPADPKRPRLTRVAVAPRPRCRTPRSGALGERLRSRRWPLAEGRSQGRRGTSRRPPVTSPSRRWPDDRSVPGRVRRAGSHQHIGGRDPTQARRCSPFLDGEPDVERSAEHRDAKRPEVETVRRPSSRARAAPVPSARAVAFKAGPYALSDPGSRFGQSEQSSRVRHGSPVRCCSPRRRQRSPTPLERELCYRGEQLKLLLARIPRVPPTKTSGARA